MNKFENVDIIASLDAIMRENTAFYQSDFEIDKEMIQRAAASQNAGDKTLLWFSRPSGTQCSRERDVLLKDTAPHNTWRYFGEQTRDHILAYAVTITGTEDGTIRGNLYELDFRQHFQHVMKQALPADTYTLIYEQGERKQPAKQYFDGNPDPQLGEFERYEAKPNDPDALRFLLQQEQRSRERLKPGNFKEHTAALHDSRIRREAGRVLSELQDLKEPNSPDKTHFMVELSPYFTAIASSKDTDRLLSMLPFKKLSLSNLKERHGIYAFLPKDENRDKGLRKPRQSIRAQLAADKAAPKKAAAKSKHHDMEV
ncbi:hypothetical protein DFR60_12649 [Hungatella effluvii]|uniref:Uncharacterized protein n=1 Tax=Hungatella effluvii TaxID=1096246 RepID=A0A2V3XUJ5_9FIRM|nr:hypothetical protein [Hungatella effluvii]PXX44562.1 hypothetical protein DFR60_12649 [Hungatella effluvii]